MKKKKGTGGGGAKGWLAHGPGTHSLTCALALSRTAHPWVEIAAGCGVALEIAHALTHAASMLSAAAPSFRLACFCDDRDSH